MLLLVGWGSYRGARGQATSGSSGRAPGISDLGLLLKGPSNNPEPQHNILCNVETAIVCSLYSENPSSVHL
jgi:hypothetical protein